MTTLRILTKTESYVVCSTTARSSHYLAWSSESPVKLLTFPTILLDQHTSARPVKRPHIRSRELQISSFFVALTKQPTSNDPNLKPPVYDTSLSTLSKVQDKAYSIKCSKLTSLSRILVLELTQTHRSGFPSKLLHDELTKA